MVKVAKFLIGAGTLVSGFALAPLSAGAQDAPPLQGNVSTSTIDISVSPRALLNLPTGALTGIPVVGSTLNGVLDKLSIQLDTSSVDGILTSARNDLDSGKAVSKAVNINIKGLDELLGNLTGAIGTLNQVTTLVPSLGGQITPLIASLTAPINGLVGGLGPASVNKSVSAALVHGGPGSTAGSNVLDHLSPLPGFDLTLAPFAATATNVASLPDIAKQLPGITGPQTEAHSTTQNLAIGQTLTLPSPADLTGLLNTVTGMINGLTPVVNQVTALPPAQQVTSTIGGILAGAPASPATPITSSLATQLTSGTPAAAVTSTLTDTLAKLQGALGILNGLGGLNGLSLNKLIAADGVTTSSLLQPQDNGVHGLATSKFTDIKLLQLLGDTLAGPLGLPVGTPLLELTGAQSSAEALVDGVSNTAPTGSSKLGAINVLGKQVLNLGAVLAPGTSQTIPVDLGALGALTLQVTSGVPVIANSSPTHKSVQVGALDVTLFNGRADGTGQIGLLGGGGIGLASTGPLSHAALTASSPNAIIKASFASSAVDVAAGPVSTTTTTPVTNAASPQPQGQLPKTGKLGPVALILGAVLIAGGLSMRLIPGAAARLRRRQQ